MKDRTEKVVLSPMHSARLELATDGERLGVSVSDPYGAITRKTVLEYLSRCFTEAGNLVWRNDREGAGLGLYLCFSSVSSFIVNVSPGIRTEFIGLIDISVAAKDSGKLHPSFHYFSTNHDAPQFLANRYKRTA
jgi:hypothetical protein